MIESNIPQLDDDDEFDFPLTDSSSRPLSRVSRPEAPVSVVSENYLTKSYFSKDYNQKAEIPDNQNRNIHKLLIYIGGSLVGDRHDC